jgi:hypothetical protein
MAILTRVRNPILWQEFTHQQRSGPRWMRWGSVLGILLVGSAIFYVTTTLSRLDAPTREFALIVIWIVHAATAVRAVVAGANTISREHVGQTWDALVLTGVSARRILFGKWRAALWRVRGWALVLGAVRLAMLPIFMLALINRFVYFNSYRYNASYSNGYLYEVEFTWVPTATLIAVVMTVVLTILDVLCCTALGMAASAVCRRGSLATAIAIMIRFTPVTLFAAFTRYEIGAVPSYRLLRFTPFALADGGTSPLYQLVLPLMPWTQGRHFEALPGLFLAMALIAVLLVAALGVAFVAIRMTGALPHPKETHSGIRFAAVAYDGAGPD